MITGVSPMSVHHACQWLALPFPSALTLVVVILQWRKLLDSEAVVDKLVEQVGVQLCCWMAELLVDRIGEPQQQLAPCRPSAILTATPGRRNCSPGQEAAGAAQREGPAANAETHDQSSHRGASSSDTAWQCAG